jgi:hypothetical protein
VGHDLEDSAERISGLEDFVDFFFHALFGFGVSAIEQNFFASVKGANLLPGDLIGQRDGAGRDDVAENLDAEFAQEKFGDRAQGNASG